MRCYVAPIPSTLSKGIHRVADALAKYAPPDVEIVTDQADLGPGDLLVCHVIGPEGWAEHLLECHWRDRRYAIWQYCLKTTTWPHPWQWAGVWRDAAVVASYYPLEDAWETAGKVLGRVPNFLHTPLGVDTDVFRPDPTMAGPNHHAYDQRPYLVATSGYVAGTESVGEWGRVCEARGRAQFHLGPDMTELAHTRVARQGISDAVLADWYSRCAFVSGLRRTEGFELPAFEGLACGARPIMFDRPDARQWLDGHAYFVPEVGPEELIHHLIELTEADPLGPVTAAEIDWVKEQFSWRKMATKFWAAIGR